jgi:hypothetical protein
MIGANSKQMNIFVKNGFNSLIESQDPFGRGAIILLTELIKK